MSGAPNEIGARVKLLRKSLRLSQKDFSVRIGYAMCVISYVENGRYTPSARFLDSVCQAFPDAASWLRTGEGDPPEASQMPDQVSIPGDRVFALRKMLGMSQETFGKYLALSDGGIQRIECGAQPLSDRNVRLICLLFPVNETWLRTGEGVPLLSDTPVGNGLPHLGNENSQLLQLINEAAREPLGFRCQFLLKLADYSASDWAMLERTLRSLLPDR